MNRYVIIRGGIVVGLFSETVMRWVGLGISLSGLVSILSVVPDIMTFVRQLYSIPFAIITLAPAAFAIVGSCVSIEIASRKKRGRRFLVLVPLLLVYPTEFFELEIFRHIVQGPILGEYFNASSIFLQGTILRTLGGSYYVSPLVITVIIVATWLVSQMKLQRRQFLGVLFGGVIGVFLNFLIVILVLGQNGFGTHWRIWTLTTTTLVCAFLGGVSPRILSAVGTRSKLFTVLHSVTSHEPFVLFKDEVQLVKSSALKGRFVKE
jgi:hypothetical protein